MTVKTIAEWEKEKGMLLPSRKPTEKISEDDFNAIPLDDKIGVDHESRVKFLKDNGYEVTRENMVDSELSAKPPKKSK